jgi:predicted phage-related endonuclease
MRERLAVTSRDQLLAERKGFVGGSEVPIVCGVAAYGSLAQLYAEKKGLRPPLIDSGVLRRGRWGEAAVFQALSDERPEWDVRRAAVHVRDTARKFACTPDGFANRPDRVGIGLLETKVSARSRFRGWLDSPDDSVVDGPATPPPAYVLQTLAGMMLNECTWGVLAVLINGEFDWTLRLFDIERDPVIEDRILHGVDAFWRDYFDPGIMPPFEPQRDEALIKQLYPKDDGSEIDLSGDNRALVAVEELIEAQDALGRLKKTEASLKAELTGKLGEHTYARLADGRRLSWKQQSRKAYAVEAATYRVLRILKSERREFDR